VDNGTTPTDLELDGPDGTAIFLLNAEESSSQTLTAQFNSQFSAIQEKFTDVSICQPESSATLPGTPSVSGGFAGICFTITSQGAAAVPYEIVIWDGLVSGSGFQELISAQAAYPKSTSSAVINQSLIPVLDSAHWLLVQSTSS
jgi:hypothetical protein